VAFHEDPHDIPGLGEALDAEVAGNISHAILAYESLLESPDPVGWAAASGLMALHRSHGDFKSAMELNQRLKRLHPDRNGLLDLWEADTLILAGERDRAEGVWFRASYSFPAERVLGRPVGMVALRQLARLFAGEGRPNDAATLLKETLRLYPSEFPTIESAEYRLAEALFLEAQASSESNLGTPSTMKDLGTFLHSKSPAAAAVFLQPGADRALAGIHHVLFHVSDADRALLEVARKAQSDPRPTVVVPLIEAKAGFQLPPSSTSMALRRAAPGPSGRRSTAMPRRSSTPSDPSPSRGRNWERSVVLA
jgi:tetratricopeptide (TPR) repeat protein